ncbi:MAG: hypothetical protein ACI9VN_002108 [Patescibacteria group bacterium]
MKNLVGKNEKEQICILLINKFTSLSFREKNSN